MDIRVVFMGTPDFAKESLEAWEEFFLRFCDSWSVNLLFGFT